MLPVAARPPLGWPARCVLAVFAAALLGALWVHPFAVGSCALALGGVVAALGRREALRLAQSRAGESICQFARSIDCRRVDTWVVRAVYDLLGLQTYFTAGEKEVRCWTIKKGWKAPQAAGVIHTDFEKGFIKAEVVSYTDLTTLGSVAAARDAGKYRLEGKDYVFKDGDVALFRFNN